MPGITARGAAVCWCAIVALVLAGCGQTGEEIDPPRNIVVILTDDQRYDALGFQNPYFETPRLDELAQVGIVFDNAFVTTSVCGPSRASILTGQWNFRHGVPRNSIGAEPIPPTFPELLQTAGYETAFIGKWHLGAGAARRPGFDYWASYDDQGVYNDQVFNVNGTSVETQGHNADSSTDLAVQFLERDRDKPFLLFLSHKAVHAPFLPADRHRGSFDGRAFPRTPTIDETPETDGGKPHWVEAQRHSWLGVAGRYADEDEFNAFAQRYAEAVRTVDDSVGRIVDTLKEQGLFDSTLLVFTSDNGFMMGEHGLVAKRTMYEASIRVPMIVTCPDLFEGGQRRDQMVLNVDIAPTLLEAAGCAPPDRVQGKSFYPLLIDPGAPWRDAFVYAYFWEDAFPQTPTILGLRTDRYKLIRYLGIFDRMELYDLQADPNETRNLVADYFTPHTRATTLRNLYSTDTPPEVRDLVAGLYERMNAELDALEFPGELGTTTTAPNALKSGDDGD